MKKSEIDDALASLWVLVHESEPVVIGSQALHGKYPDVADSIMFSREVDVILPNKSKLGNWLVDVVGDGTPFSVDRGYYIDHVLVKEGFPVLAEGWDLRAFRQPFIFNGEAQGQVRFLSPEDLVISKLGAGRPKDFEFINELSKRGYVKLEDVEKLVFSVPDSFKEKIEIGINILKKLRLAVECPVAAGGGVAPSFSVGQRFEFKAGDEVVANGFRGVIAVVHDGQLAGVVDVRLPGGLVSVSASFPDCFPAVSNGVEVVTEGQFFGKV